MNSQYVSKERLEELRAELENLKNKKRIEVAERLKTAKEYGDLSENAEYSEARDEQAIVEGRIAELEELMKNAVTIMKASGGDTVRVGSTIEVKKGGKSMKYMLVGTYEANPEEAKISDESPMGKAFLGRKLGDTVAVVTPVGIVKYEIIKIE